MIGTADAKLKETIIIKLRRHLYIDCFAFGFLIYISDTRLVRLKIVSQKFTPTNNAYLSFIYHMKNLRQTYFISISKRKKKQNQNVLFFSKLYNEARRPTTLFPESSRPGNVMSENRLVRRRFHFVF